MKKLFLLGLGFLVSLYAYTSAAKQAITQTTLPSVHRVFIFGDSLSDIGNLQAATRALFPNPKTYFMGRFSNGYTWSDDLAADYGTTVKDNNFIVNYAVGGATAFPYVKKVSVFHVVYRLVGSLDRQLNQFSKAYDKFKPTDLIILWIGANDLLWAGDMYFCGKLTKACIKGRVQVADQGTIIRWAVDAVKKQVQKMEEKYGAQHIIILGLPDFSIVPRYIFDQSSQAALKSANVKLYNDKLKTFITKNQTTGPAHDIAYYDVDKLLKELIHNKAELDRYKITDVRHSCLHHNEEPAQKNWEDMAENMVLDPEDPLSMCAAIPMLRDALPDQVSSRSRSAKYYQEKYCGNSYLFWDTAHPTKKGHFVIAQHLLNYLLRRFDVSRVTTDTGLCCGI